MKLMKCISLFVVCMTMTACGENLDNYKQKVLEQLAKESRTTPELFVKDYNVVVDYMSVTSITVADSIAVINLWKAKKDEIEKSIEIKREQLHSLFNFDKESDRKSLKLLEAKLKEIQESENLLEKYASMQSDEVLGKFFSCRISVLIPLLGRQTEAGGFIFDKEGVWFKQEADNIMFEYYKEKKQK